MKYGIKIIATALLIALCLPVFALAASTTTTGSEHIRSGAGLGYVSLGTVPSGKTLNYDNTATDARGVKWYHVTYNGVAGWISSKYTTTGSSSGGSSSGGSSSGGSSSTTGTKITTTGSLHLRSGAGTGYVSLGVVPKGTAVYYDNTSKDKSGNTWFHITYKGVKGWISSIYTTGGSASYTGGVSASGTVSTTAKLNFRKGPGTTYDVIGYVPKGAKVSYTQTGKDSAGTTWYRVTYGGKTGWITSVYTKAASSSSSTPSTAVGKVKTTGSLHIRSGAGLGYVSLGTVSSGVTLSYDKTSKDARGVMWYHITYSGVTGWISSKYATKV